MRITVLCPHFRPDVAPTGVVMTRIADELIARGHELHVVTSLPWYLEHRVDPAWRGRPFRVERTPWGRITRVHPFPTDKGNIPARALAFGGFTAATAAAAALARTSPDLVLAMSPPLTLGPAAWGVARLRRAAFVFNVQDVFPDVAVELGAITDPRVVRAAQWLERTTYRLADATTVLSDDLAKNVAAKLARAGGAADRVRVIPNFVDVEAIRPADRDNAYRRDLGLGDRTVVLYAGNVGLSQSLGLLVDAARALRAREDVVFVVNGGGSGLSDLRRAAAGLPNIVFAPFQPVERLPEVLAAGDVHVVPLKRGLASSSVPSKSYSVLAAGRPMLAAVDAGTEITRMIDDSGAGVCVPPDDPPAFVAALVRLLDDPARREAMGRAGRRWVEQWASPAAIAERYEALFEEVVARRRDFGRRARGR